VATRNQKDHWHDFAGQVFIQSNDLFGNFMVFLKRVVQ